MEKSTEHEKSLIDRWHPGDNCLDQITYDEIVLTVKCNIKNTDISEKTVRAEFEEIMEMKNKDANDLFNLHLPQIMKEIKGV